MRTGGSGDRGEGASCVSVAHARVSCRDAGLPRGSWCEACLEDQRGERSEGEKPARSGGAQRAPVPEWLLTEAHHFASTVEAYDACQSDDAICDGDILVVPSEGVVGVLVEAWPTAITVAHGAFHRLRDSVSWSTFEGGKYLPSVVKGRQLAVRLFKGEQYRLPIGPRWLGEGDLIRVQEGWETVDSLRLEVIEQGLPWSGPGPVGEMLVVLSSDSAGRIRKHELADISAVMDAAHNSKEQGCR